MFIIIEPDCTDNIRFFQPNTNTDNIRSVNRIPNTDIRLTTKYQLFGQPNISTKYISIRLQPCYKGYDQISFRQKFSLDLVLFRSNVPKFLVCASSVGGMSISRRLAKLLVLLCQTLTFDG